MKTKLNGILTLLLALVVQVAFAQETITGKVIDADGPLLGATVIVVGTNTAATTDFDGNYSITAAASDTLQFSYAGYDNESVIVGTQSVINITMETSLDAVIVTGYKNLPKKKSAIAEQTISAETIEDRPNASFVQTLQGQVAGLNIQTASGQPGANSLIQLRGPSSLNGNTEPLFIIDGAPVDEDNFRSLNPNEIASVTTLKDAGATAIYGNRGANGVIVITTKRGRFNQPLRINYTATTGFSQIIQPDYNLLSAPEYLNLEASRNTGRGATLTEAERAAAQSEDWLDVFFQTGITSAHTLSFSSGSENMTSYTSFGYTDQEGTLIKSGLQRFNFRNNLTGRSQDGKFTFGTNVSLNFSRNELPGSVGTGGVNNNFSLGALRSLPYLLESDYMGSDIPGQLRNTPLLLIDRARNIDRRTDELKIIASGNANYQITDELSAGYFTSIDYTNSNFRSYVNPDSFNGTFFRQADQGFGGSEFQDDIRDFRYNSRANLTYVKSFGADDKHTLSGSAYLEYNKSHLLSFNFFQTGLDDRLSAPGNGSFLVDSDQDDFYVPEVGAGITEVGLFSYFGDFDYDFDGTYGLSATIRRDASSRFSDDNRWGTFFSVAGRWNVSAEEFMNGSVINNLKLRASYGEVGNERIGGGYYASTTIPRTNVGNTLYGNQLGLFRGGFGNPDIQWEVVKQTNIGIDYGVWDDRLRGALDIYRRDTDDLFLTVPTAVSVYGQTGLFANSGLLRNSGIEFRADYDLIQKKTQDGLNLTVRFNGAYNKNELIELTATDGRIEGVNTIQYEGGSITELFTIPYVGVNPSNGNLLFLDQNGNPTENPTNDDRRITGKDAIPDYQGSFGFDLDYKNFFFTTQFNFITGIDQFDFDQSGLLDPSNIGNFNLSRDILRAWTPTNRVTDIPSLDAANVNVAGTRSDRFVREADFLRLRFVSLGYNFPSEMLESTFLTSGRVFVNAENLLTFTKWRGSDPESPTLSQQSEFPTPRIFTLGLDLNF